MLIHCAIILTYTGSRAARRDKFSLAHSAMDPCTFLLRQASSTTQVLVQWDSCIEKERIAANDSQRTCYHTGDKKCASRLSGLVSTLTPHSIAILSCTYIDVLHNTPCHSNLFSLQTTCRPPIPSSCLHLRRFLHTYFHQTVQQWCLHSMFFCHAGTLFGVSFPLVVTPLVLCQLADSNVTLGRHSIYRWRPSKIINIFNMKVEHIFVGTREIQSTTSWRSWRRWNWQCRPDTWQPRCRSTSYNRKQTANVGKHGYKVGPTSITISDPSESSTKVS